MAGSWRHPGVKGNLRESGSCLRAPRRGESRGEEPGREERDEFIRHLFLISHKHSLLVTKELQTPAEPPGGLIPLPHPPGNSSEVTHQSTRPRRQERGPFPGPRPGAAEAIYAVPKEEGERDEEGFSKEMMGGWEDDEKTIRRDGDTLLPPPPPSRLPLPPPEATAASLQSGPTRCWPASLELQCHHLPWPRWGTKEHSGSGDIGKGG